MEGEFAGIMLVIMPCRSDKSAEGVAKCVARCGGGSQARTTAGAGGGRESELERQPRHGDGGWEAGREWGWGVGGVECVCVGG